MYFSEILREKCGLVFPAANCLRRDKVNAHRSAAVSRGPFISDDSRSVTGGPKLGVARVSAHYRRIPRAYLLTREALSPPLTTQAAVAELRGPINMSSFPQFQGLGVQPGTAHASAVTAHRDFFFLSFLFRLILRQGFSV